MAKQKKSPIRPTSRVIANSDEMRQLVEESLRDIEHYETILENADDPEEAKLRIKQMYFNNLKQASMPVALSQRVLADMLTRMDIDRILNKEVDPLSDRYLAIIKQLNQNIKLVRDMQAPMQSAGMAALDDTDFKIVDAEAIENAFNEFK